MLMTIAGKVEQLEAQLARHVLGTPLAANILAHILSSKLLR